MSEELKHPGGRPKHPIDWEQVEEMCKIQCTQEEIAAVIKCSVDTLDRRSRETHGISFAEFFDQKRKGGRCSLRRKQWLSATEEGVPSMLIWLGKQYLGQSDKNQLEAKVEESKLIIQMDDKE